MEKEGGKYYPKCENIEEINKDNLQEDNNKEKVGASKFGAHVPKCADSKEPFIAKSNESKCKDISPNCETIKIEENPQPKQELDPVAKGENVTDEEENRGKI